jgi:DNA-binding transcriptional LysR family regulator
LIVNDIELSLGAVRDGLGLAYLLHDYIAADLKAGRLVPLLEDWSPKLSGFFLYHPSRRQVTGPLQALITFLKAEAFRRGVSPATPPSAGVYPTHRLVGRSRK